jgi:hypothetical protein
MELVQLLQGYVQFFMILPLAFIVIWGLVIVLFNRE